MNIGVIGSGFIVETFIGTSKLIKDFHLTAIWGRHKAKLLKFKDEFDYYTTDLEKILSDKNIDVIYIALPNSLHYEYALKALKHHKHVIVEKPFTVHYKDAKKLVDYAKDNDLLLFEAITTMHNPMYRKMKKLVNKLGDIKIVQANFSQYSRRYDRFKNGEVLPVFNSRLAGGALLDLNVYNVHFVVGMFGKPKKVKYYPNKEKGVDTSGILILDYGKFKATLTAAKDCSGDNFVLIEGDKGNIRCNTTSSRCGSYTLNLHGKESETFYDQDEEFGAWIYEMKEFNRLYKNMDLKKNYEYNKDTLLVVKVLEDSLKSAKIFYK